MFRKTVRTLLRKAGYDVKRYCPNKMAADPFCDMRNFLTGVDRPLILDIGANLGQSVDRFRKTLPNTTIHSFEPSPGTYALLREHCLNLESVNAWNLAVGSKVGTLPFIESSHSDMSSFKSPGKECWGSIERIVNVNVVTLDKFVAKEGIEFIHVLKSDTQGYEMEVMKGAEELFSANKVGLVYMEVTFCELYEDLPPLDEILRYLYERDFVLVNFYHPNIQNELLGWMDVLFINRKFYDAHREHLRTAESLR